VSLVVGGAIFFGEEMAALAGAVGVAGEGVDAVKLLDQLDDRTLGTSSGDAIHCVAGRQGVVDGVEFGWETAKSRLTGRALSDDSAIGLVIG
jgi:hypothetical protein